MSHYDVVIVGAGLSGIGAAYHLQKKSPNKSFVIFEARDALGGTWDLFRYPGIRSDSDMYTLGFSFRPWTNPKAIADGPAILAYLKETAEAYGIDRKIRYRHRVTGARWSSRDARWTLDVNGETVTCNFLYACTGYYEYEAGYTPDFPGLEDFRGKVIHPQAWSSDVDYEGKKVVVIGSGATAVTLVPELAKRAAHVTMLQRSPTYVVSMPERDKVADFFRAKLPSMPAYVATRWKNVIFSMAFYQWCRRYPEHAKKMLVGFAKRSLRDKVDTAHFTPAYNPWDQRVCLVPNGDLFRTLRRGQASVVTDHIDRFTEKGIRLRSGQELEADLVVSATGLVLKFLGGIDVHVDGEPVDPGATLAYKGFMLSGVPNLAIALGYTNASWTLKCELTSEYVCRLLAYMDARGYRECRPRRDPSIEERPLIDFSSGYVTRALPKMPRQGTVAPWRLYQNYALDLMSLRHARVNDGTLEFAR